MAVFSSVHGKACRLPRSGEDHGSPFAHTDLEDRYQTRGILEEIVCRTSQVSSGPIRHDLAKPGKYLLTFSHRELTSIIRMIEQRPKRARDRAPRSVAPKALHGLEIDAVSRGKCIAECIETRVRPT